QIADYLFYLYFIIRGVNCQGEKQLCTQLQSLAFTT
ncbi:uncharacterized protein METZ01_LOCUS299738, partial [marine metagenome]